MSAEGVVLPSDAESLGKIVGDCESTDHDIRTRLADIRAMRRVARQARDPRPAECPGDRDALAVLSRNGP